MGNLKYGNEHLSDEDIIKFCKKMNIDSWIRKLPEGYNTILKGNGSNLSDGERQILCYERTIINNPKIFFLKDKKISEVGTHEELMNKKGDYYNLYMSQKI